MSRSAFLVKDLENFLFQWAPKPLAEPWDRVGLLVGDPLAPVQNIAVALDATVETISEALRLGANVLVTHHPLFLKPISDLVLSDPVTKRIHLAIQHQLNLLALHTNLDATARGLNDLFGERLGVQNSRVFLKSAPLKTSEQVVAGLGRIAAIEAVSLQSLVNRVCKAFGLSFVRYVGDPLSKIAQIAWVTGSGQDFWKEAKKEGADVLITGDLKYHVALDAREAGFALIDVGHFASEIGMVGRVAETLRQEFKQRSIAAQVFESCVERDPFLFYFNS